LIAQIEALLNANDAGKLFATGLHESVQTCLTMLNQLGQDIAQTYHFH
jgi:hypothetical protein